MLSVASLLPLMAGSSVTEIPFFPVLGPWILVCTFVSEFHAARFDRHHKQIIMPCFETRDHAGSLFASLLFRSRRSAADRARQVHASCTAGRIARHLQ